MNQFSERTIKVSKDTLLEKLKENRIKHITDYNEAYKIFVENYIERLDYLAEKVSEGMSPEMHIKMIVPKSYEDDYTQIIDMLEMSIENEVEITAEEFQAYVKNKWNWTQTAFDAFSNYTRKSY